eukprot:134264-Chlamydomonas_euryale.AAC.7
MACVARAHACPTACMASCARPADTVSHDRERKEPRHSACCVLHDPRRCMLMLHAVCQASHDRGRRSRSTLHTV